MREISRQVFRENEVDILHGVLASDHIRMLVSVPPKLAISDLVREMQVRSSQKAQREFPAIRKRYWAQRFLGRGYFSTTNSSITEDILLQYLEKHIADLTGISQSFSANVPRTSIYGLKEKALTISEGPSHFHCKRT